MQIAETQHRKTTNKSPLQVNHAGDIDWDESTETLVVGFGAAGAVAAGDKL